jgi:hypothetical protein
VPFLSTKFLSGTYRDISYYFGRVSARGAPEIFNYSLWVGAALRQIREIENKRPL